jgi:hypothetical protein
VVHAHAHLLAVPHTLASIGGKRCPNIREAVESAREGGEYLMVGQLGGEFELLHPYEATEKRIARRILARIIHESALATT